MNEETKNSRGEGCDSRGQEATKKRYAAPQLIHCGSLVELTNGPINGVTDGFFSGTGGT